MSGHILITDKQHPSVAPMADLCDRTQLSIKWRLDDCTGGKWLFLVSCDTFVPRSVRSLYEHTLVLHASDLPEGRGWSPWVHAIREGAERLTLSVIEAEDEIDSGKVWLKQVVDIDKGAIYEEIAHALATLQADTIEWVMANEDIGWGAEEQQGEPTVCRKLTEHDSEIDSFAQLYESWDKLRTCDPNRFPAWFVMHGQRYNIRIERAEA